MTSSYFEMLTVVEMFPTLLCGESSGTSALANIKTVPL